jgi:TRAP-type transport system periplasmic protein
VLNISKIFLRKTNFPNNIMKKYILSIFSFFLFLQAPSLSYGITLKIATISPEGSFEVTEMRKASKEIKSSTKGRVKLKFYPGGVMGNDQAVIKKIRFRQLQGGLVSASSLASFNHDGQIYCLPFLFRSFPEVDYVRKEMDQLIIAGYKKAGFTIFGIAEGGFAHILSKNPVRTVKDLQQQKVWSPDKDIASITAIEAYNVKPIPLSMGDVRTGLQTGLINTVAIPPAYGIIFQWHTMVKYFTELPILYTYGILAIENKAFSRLKPADQSIVTEIMTATFKKIDRKNREKNEKALLVLKDIGLKIVKPNETEKQDWISMTKDVGKELVKNNKMRKNTLETMTRLLKEFRSTPGNQ